MGRCGSTSCNFPAAIKLPVKVSEPMMTSMRDLHHLKFREVGNAHVILGNADHRRGQRAKSVAEGGPLGHGGHGHQAEGNADNRAHRQRHDDPFVFDDLVVAERGGDGQDGAELARQHAVLGRRR